MYAEMPINHQGKGKKVNGIRGYRTLDQVRDRVTGVVWRQLKVYELFENKPPRRLLKKELLALGAVGD